MKKRHVQHPPEQRAEPLLQVLGAETTEDGVNKAQALIGAVLTEPLIMTISINRATGRVSSTSNIAADRLVDDLKILHEVTLMLNKQISEQMVKAASSPYTPSPVPAGQGK